MKVTVIDEQNTDIRWEFRQEPKSGRMAVKWLKDGTQEQIIAALQQALEEAIGQRLMTDSVTSNELITIDKKLFKELLHLAFKIPNFLSELCAVNIDSSTTGTVEATVTLDPSDFFLRLSTAIRTCG